MKATDHLKPTPAFKKKKKKGASDDHFVPARLGQSLINYSNTNLGVAVEVSFKCY